MFATNIRTELSSKFVEKSWKVADYEKLSVLSEAVKNKYFGTSNGLSEKSQLQRKHIPKLNTN